MSALDYSGGRRIDIHPTAKAGRFLRRIPSYLGRFSEVPVSMADARRSISIPARSYSASAGCHGVSRRSRNSYRYSEFAFGKCFTAGPSPANRQHSIVKDQSVPVYDCPSGTQPGRYSRIGHPQYARNRQCLTGPTVHLWKCLVPIGRNYVCPHPGSDHKRHCLTTRFAVPGECVKSIVRPAPHKYKPQKVGRIHSTVQ